MVIIILSQYFIQFHAIGLLTHGETLMNPFIWGLLVLTTCIIASSGYIINDLYDVAIDSINKPEKTLIPHKISPLKAKIYYWSLVMIGFGVSGYIALTINFISHLWIYPLSVSLLYLYASHFKSTVLWGNIIVSIFVAWVWGILFYIEATQKSNSWVLFYIGLGFSSIGFLINLMREIIKDIEDKDGDHQLGIKTLPIMYGIHVAKTLVYILGLVVFFLIIYSLHLIDGPFELNMFGVLIECLLLLALIKTYTSQQKSDFSKVSGLLKIIMLMGIMGIYLVAKSLS